MRAESPVLNTGVRSAQGSGSEFGSVGAEFELHVALDVYELSYLNTGC